MKHIKSFNESFIENDIQSLKDIFIHLKDDGYKIEYFSKKAVNAVGSPVFSISVKITNPTEDFLGLTSYDLVSSLKEAVSLMKSLDYEHQARYVEHGCKPIIFYIYLDKRPLSYKFQNHHLSIDENPPRPHIIYLDFYI
jgi:hypothetical protein